MRKINDITYDKIMRVDLSGKNYDGVLIVQKNSDKNVKKLYGK